MQRRGGACSFSFCLARSGEKKGCHTIHVTASDSALAGSFRRLLFSAVIKALRKRILSSGPVKGLVVTLMCGANNFIPLRIILCGCTGELIRVGRTIAIFATCVQAKVVLILS
jgi:hypothetical protein